MQPSEPAGWWARIQCLRELCGMIEEANAPQRGLASDLLEFYADKNRRNGLNRPRPTI
jgi:hypothetical protein